MVTTAYFLKHQLRVIFETYIHKNKMLTLHKNTHLSFHFSQNQSKPFKSSEVVFLMCESLTKNNNRKEKLYANTSRSACIIIEMEIIDVRPLTGAFYVGNR